MDNSNDNGGGAGAHGRNAGGDPGTAKGAVSRGNPGGGIDAGVSGFDADGTAAADLRRNGGRHDLGTALITGASTGIGATYARHLARRGFDLILVARNAERLAALAAELESRHGAKVAVVAADLTVRPDLARVEQILSDDVRINLLVNNAGTATLAPFAAADVDRLDRELQLNVVAPTRLARALLPRLLERDRGAIINIASVMSQMIQPGNAVYGGTKAYLLHFSEVLSLETAASKVRIQAVLPGATRTPIWETSGFSLDNIPPENVMEVDELVGAALAGFDQGERVTVPSLPDPADWQRLAEARDRLRPNLSRQHAAGRYRVAAVAAPAA